MPQKKKRKKFKRNLKNKLREGNKKEIWWLSQDLEGEMLLFLLHKWWHLQVWCQDLGECHHQECMDRRQECIDPHLHKCKVQECKGLHLLKCRVQECKDLHLLNSKRIWVLLLHKWIMDLDLQHLVLQVCNQVSVVPLHSELPQVSGHLQDLEHLLDLGALLQDLVILPLDLVDHLQAFLAQDDFTSIFW